MAYKTVSVTADILGSSFSPESKLVGDTNQLWGIPAVNIISVWVHNLSLTPNATLVWGTYGQNLYVSSTQSCSASYNAHPTLTLIYKK